MFACDDFGYVPDIITCAKGMTSGYSPIGAMIASDRLFEPFSKGTTSFPHGYTFGGHPVSAAVAMANLDIFEREGLNDAREGERPGVPRDPGEAARPADRRRRAGRGLLLRDRAGQGQGDRETFDVGLLGGADDAARVDVEVEGEPGDGAVVGDRDRAAERLEGARVGEVAEVALDPRLVGEVGVDPREQVVLVRQPRRRTSGRRSRRRPARRGARGGRRSSSRQPSRPSGGEDRQHRGGEHRVAGDDREAGAGEDREGAERQDGGGDADRAAAAQEGEAEDDAAERRRPSPATAAPRRAGAGRRGRGRPGRSGGRAFRPFRGCR